MHEFPKRVDPKHGPNDGLRPHGPHPFGRTDQRHEKPRLVVTVTVTPFQARFRIREFFAPGPLRNAPIVDVTDVVSHPPLDTSGASFRMGDAAKPRRHPFNAPSQGIETRRTIEPLCLFFKATPPHDAPGASVRHPTSSVRKRAFWGDGAPNHECSERKWSVDVP